jgi:hypothetical protein
MQHMTDMGKITRNATKVEARCITFLLSDAGIYLLPNLLQISGSKESMGSDFRYII